MSMALAVAYWFWAVCKFASCHAFLQPTDACTAGEQWAERWSAQQARYHWTMVNQL